MPNGCELSGRGSIPRMPLKQHTSGLLLAFGVESPVRSSELLCDGKDCRDYSKPLIFSCETLAIEWISCCLVTELELAIVHNDISVNFDSAPCWDDIHMYIRKPWCASQIPVGITEGDMDTWHLLIL